MSSDSVSLTGQKDKRTDNNSSIDPISGGPTSGDSRSALINQDLDQFITSVYAIRGYLQSAARRANLRPYDARLCALDAPWRHERIREAMRHAEKRMKLTVAMLDNVKPSNEYPTIFNTDGIDWMKKSVTSFIDPIEECVNFIPESFTNVSGTRKKWSVIAFRWFMDLAGGGKKIDDFENRIVARVNSISDLFNNYVNEIDRVISNTYRNIDVSVVSYGASKNADRFT